MDEERTSAAPDSGRDATPRPAPAPRHRDAGTVESIPATARTAPATPTAESKHAIDPRLVADPRPPVEAPIPTNIYRARRPAVAAFLILPAVAVGLLLVRALAVSTFGDTFVVGGFLASVLGLASLPLLVSGLYGLITGAAHGAEQWGFRVWARPPLAYLLVGIAFVITASLAAG